MSDRDDVLRDLLGAAAPDPGLADPRADLRRGREALRRRRVRQVRAAGAGVAALVLLVALLGQQVTGPWTASDPGEVAPPPSTGAPTRPSPDPSDSPSMDTFAAPEDDEIRLLSTPLEAGPFTFGKTPEGWATQGQDRVAATIAPTDGSVSEDPSDYVGKITVMMASVDQPVRPPGSRVVEADGRRFVVSRTVDGGATWVTARTRPGEPAGRVQVQFWNGSPWDEESMVEFTASVRVTDDVLGSVG